MARSVTADAVAGGTSEVSFTMDGSRHGSAFESRPKWCTKEDVVLEEGMRTVITREQSTVQLYCTTAAWQCITKSQPRTGHTREPDPTHNELKHTTTRKTASHERTPDKPHVHTHTHTPPAPLPQPPPRASAPARGTIACASSTDLSASASGGRWLVGSSVPCGASIQLTLSQSTLVCRFN